VGGGGEDEAMELLPTGYRPLGKRVVGGANGLFQRRFDQPYRNSTRGNAAGILAAAEKHLKLMPTLFRGLPLHPFG